MEFRFCPSCGKERIPGSKFCPFCGVQIPAAAPQESVPATTTAPAAPAGPAAPTAPTPPVPPAAPVFPAALNPPGAPVSPAAPTAQKPGSSPPVYAQPVAAGGTFPAQPVRRKRALRWALGGALVLVLIAALVLWWMFFGPGRAGRSASGLDLLNRPAKATVTGYTDGDVRHIVFADGADLSFEGDVPVLYDAYSQTVYYIEPDAPGEHIGVLYQRKVGGESVKIDENVIGVDKAALGEGVYYIREGTDQRGMYSYSNGQSAYICDDMDSAVPSPDGSTLFYSSGGVCYKVSAGGRPEQAEPLPEDAYPVSISNDGTVLLYALGEDDSCELWFRSPAGEESLAVDSPQLFLNYDGSDILICAEDGFYRWRPDAGLETIRTSFCRPFWGVTPISCYYSSVNTYCLAVEDFDSFFFGQESEESSFFFDLYHYSGKGTNTRIAREVYSVRAAADSSSVFYIQQADGEGQLFRTSLEGQETRTEALAEDIYDYKISDDGRVIYYLRSDNKGYTVRLFRQEEGKEEEIAQDVSGSYYITPDGRSCLYLVDVGAESGCGDAYLCHAGEEPRLLIADLYDMEGEQFDQGAFLWTNYREAEEESGWPTYDLYYYDGSEVRLIAEGVSRR